MHTPSLRTARQAHPPAAVVLVFLGFLFARSFAIAESAPLYARLLARLNSRTVTDGSPFFVKTMDAWKDGRCSLKRGTTLEGQIVHVLHRGAIVKQEQLQLRFLPISCTGDEVHQFVPLLASAESSSSVFEDSLLQEALVHSFAMSQGPHAPTAGQSGAPKIDPKAEVAYAPNSSENALRIGEMRGYGKVSLTLPHFVSDPTVLTSAHPLVLDSDSRFALVLRAIPNTPTAVVSSTPAAPSNASRVDSPAAPHAAAETDPAEIDQCVAAACALAEAAGPTSAKLAMDLHLRSLGYRERPMQVLTSLAEDAAVAFLGEDQLLVTFDAHPMVSRSKPEADRSRQPRIIRAVTISVRTGKEIHQEDWREPERGQYLWPLDDGRVLARVGDTLRIYSHDLTMERQWITPGSVRYIRISPSRRIIAVAIERERHTPEEHRRLEEFLGTFRQVEEDVDLTILDQDLKVLSTNPIDGNLSPPAVLDSGLVLSDRGSNNKWAVYQLDWNHARQAIRRVDSSCPLRIDTLPANLILLAGCSIGHLTYWDKVVRPDGRVLLRGSYQDLDFLGNAEAPPNGSVFAIGMARASHTIDFGLGIVASDFQSIGVSVYRSSDGHLVFATRSNRGAVNRQSFALSDAGDQLAILSGEDVSLYRIAGSAAVASSAPPSH